MLFILLLLLAIHLVLFIINIYICILRYHLYINNNYKIQTILLHLSYVMWLINNTVENVDQVI